MSQLLFRLSKLSYRNKDVFIQKSVRLFSTSPYLTVCSVWDDALRLVEGNSHYGGIILFDPAKEETKMIPLPPLTSMLYGQTKVVWNVAMSSSSPHEEDCVVAIKFLGRQLSMCKPGRDHAWTNRLIPFDCAENSNLMYSKKDQREDHWVESPSGQSFLVRWYSVVPSLRSKDPIVMVFRED
ncbi:hypothetical protein F2Q69_00058232 [Brassica cretica]|uniref:KIB1-4 beta-propeller domain-containing protein n=1 Tax=Brassica cretica TaxID=69181 RepID=A0A8S9RHN3_BRACR|nr:hypothetical protein F2Q69_00058232 [Brassica cretica]